MNCFLPYEYRELFIKSAKLNLPIFSAARQCFDRHERGCVIGPESPLPSLESVAIEGLDEVGLSIFCSCASSGSRVIFLEANDARIQ